MEIKFCSKCVTEKERADFSPGNFIRGAAGWCKSCVKEYNREYSSKNRDKLLLQKNQYYLDNKEDILADQKVKRSTPEYKDNARQYNLDNREHINKTRIIYQKNRRTEDPIFRSQQDISSVINQMLKKQGSSKSGNSSRNNMPFIWEEYIVHMEALFVHPDNLFNGKPWMNWENQGRYIKEEWDDNNFLTWKWQIDHIIPHADLPYTSMEDDNFKKAWSLANIRPLSAKQNQLDGASRIRHKKKRVA
jgi:hypothetical protein